MPDNFTVKTDTFEGPLELLLDLIEKRKLLVNDVSLTAVVDDYMAYVSTLEDGRTRELAQFILVAATLLLLKSKSLLPVLSLTDEEQASVEELERRVARYQLYQRAATTVRQLFGVQVLYPRTYRPVTEFIFVPDTYVTVPKLSEAIGGVLANLPKSQAPKTQVSVKKAISLEDMMARLEERIQKQLRVSFRGFSGDKSERVDVIVSFLAVLELVKRGIVAVRQEGRFADFEIEREGVGTPQYR